MTRLLSLIPDGETSLLVLRDNLYVEEIEVQNIDGVITIKTRGLDETEARRFPRGTCLSFDVTLSVVKHLVCNYDCCADSPCQIDPVTVTGVHLPQATVGQNWSGLIIFGGTPPLLLAPGVGLPSWTQAEVGENYIKFSGTPTVAGSVSVTVAGTNATRTLVAQSFPLMVA
jgi:hypothetical protein